MNLNPNQLSTYQEQGYLVIPNCFPKQFVERAVDTFESLLTRFSSECGIPRQEYVSVVCQIRDLWKYDPLFKELIFDSPLPRIAAQLMNRPAARLLHDHIIVKPKGQSGEVPWHQDYPYWPVDHNFGMSCWMALDDVSEDSGALEVIPGSHLKGEEPPVDFLASVRNEFNQHPNRIRLPIKKGDVIALHSLTWHKTGPNIDAPFRRAYISLWIPPESRYTPLHASWHPVNYNVSVQPGEFLNEDWFPVVGNVTPDAWQNLPPGKPKAQSSDWEDDEELSMFNASEKVKSQIKNLMQLQGMHEVAKEDVYTYLLKKEQRDAFVKSLAERGIIQSEERASKCLHELSINAVAWKHHKARNVYNSGYAEFRELFGVKL